VSWALAWLAFTSGACSVFALVFNIRSIALPAPPDWRIFAVIAAVSFMGALYVAAII
jgi:hypothetical protein